MEHLQHVTAILSVNIAKQGCTSAEIHKEFSELMGLDLGNVLKEAGFSRIEDFLRSRPDEFQLRSGKWSLVAGSRPELEYNEELILRSARGGRRAVRGRGAGPSRAGAFRGRGGGSTRGRGALGGQRYASTWQEKDSNAYDERERWDRNLDNTSPGYRQDNGHELRDYGSSNNPSNSSQPYGYDEYDDYYRRYDRSSDGNYGRQTQQPSYDDYYDRDEYNYPTERVDTRRSDDYYDDYSERNDDRYTDNYAEHSRYDRYAADERQLPVEDGSSRVRQAEESLLALFHKDKRDDEPSKTPAPADPPASMRAQSSSANQLNGAFSRSISPAPTAPSVGEEDVQSTEEYKKLVLADDDVNYLKECIIDAFLQLKVDTVAIATLIECVSFRLKEVCNIFDIPYDFRNSPYLRKACVTNLAFYFPQDFSYDPYSKQLSISAKAKEDANSKKETPEEKVNAGPAPQPEMPVFLPPPGISGPGSVVRAPVASSNVPPPGIGAPPGLTARRNDSSTSGATTMQKNTFSFGRLAFK